MSKTTQESTTTIRKRATMHPANIQIQRTTGGRQSFGGGSLAIGRRSVIGSSYSAPIRATGEAVKASKDCVSTVLQGRGKEKKDISLLNERFANYIQNVKFLEAQNKTLMTALEQCKRDKGYDQSRIKDEYEDELSEARSTISDLQKELSPLQASQLCLQDKIDDLQSQLAEKIKALEEETGNVRKLSMINVDLESELNSLKRQCELDAKDIETLRNDLNRVRADNERIRADFEAACSKQINAESERDALAEELSFITDTTNIEIEELRRVLSSMKSMPDIKADFQSSFKSAVAALQQEFQEQLRSITESQQIRCDELVAQARNANRVAPDSGIMKTENKTLKSSLDENRRRQSDLERENASLLAELKQLQKRMDEECEECEREKCELRDELEELRMELEEVAANLKDIMEKKYDLEIEISCYRKLLESEESSMKGILMSSGQFQSSGGAALASIISSGGGGGGGSSSQQSMSSRSESSGTIRTKMASNSNVKVVEVAMDGSAVILGNKTMSSDVDLSNWTLERNHASGTSKFKFNNGALLKAGKTLTIWAYAFEDNQKDDDLVATRMECKTWGLKNGSLSVKDQSGKERASCSIFSG